MIKSALFGLVCGFILADAGVGLTTEPILLLFYLTLLSVSHEVLK